MAYGINFRKAGKTYKIKKLEVGKCKNVATFRLGHEIFRLEVEIQSWITDLMLVKILNDEKNRYKLLTVWQKSKTRIVVMAKYSTL